MFETENKHFRYFMMANPDAVLVTKHEAVAFALRCMQHEGASFEHSQDLAEVVVAADCRGHYSHGLHRMEMYVSNMRRGILKSGAPSVLSETPATAWVDGNNLLGPTVGKFCMNLAIQKATDAGVGWVVAKRSNHNGIEAFYSMMAAERGMIGMAFTNTAMAMAPTRSAKRTIGTNPISVVANGCNGDSFVLDMATTCVATGKIQIAKIKSEELPKGWCLNEKGEDELDPNKISATQGALYPLGGKEVTSGFKGYGLGMMVELFCGILGGGKWGPHQDWFSNPNAKEADFCQCYVAIDPTAFAPGFEGRIQELMNHLRGAEPIDPKKPVLVPGDPEKSHMSIVNQLGAIPYHPNQIEAMNNLAEELNIEPIRVVKK